MKRDPQKRQLLPRVPDSGKFPLYCDFDCPHAAFAEPDALGACRRDQGVYCTVLARYNNKNGRCLVRSL